MVDFVELWNKQTISVRTIEELYTCQLSHLRRESHACGLKTHEAHACGPISHTWLKNVSCCHQSDSLKKIWLLFRVISLTSIPITYEIKTFFRVTRPPCCINPKLHHIACAMQSGTDLRGLRLFHYNVVDTNGSQFWYTCKVDSTQTEINLIQTEVIS